MLCWKWTEWKEAKMTVAQPKDVSVGAVGNIWVLDISWERMTTGLTATSFWKQDPQRLFLCVFMSLSTFLSEYVLKVQMNDYTVLFHIIMWFILRPKANMSQHSVLNYIVHTRLNSLKFIFALCRWPFQSWMLKKLKENVSKW